MSSTIQHASTGLRGASRWTRGFLWSLLCAVGLSGCAAFTPIEGVPASHLAPEFLGQSRNHRTTISPMLLTRSRPQNYLIDSGDVLSVYIPGVLGTRTPDFQAIGEAPPINIAYDPEIAPSVGYPIHVRDDGTMSLPQVAPIYVAGMTLRQVEESIQRAYSHPKQILPEGNERILVSLFRPREIRVLVVRQESSTAGGGQQVPQPGQLNNGTAKVGTARVVSLKAYENDVMHALARVQGVDGLPGLDAENMIRVIRGRSSRMNPAAGDGYVSNFSSPMMQTPVDPRFSGPEFPSSSTTGPQYGAPQYGVPQHGAPQYGAPQGGIAPMGAPQPGSVMRYQSPDSNWKGLFQRGGSRPDTQPGRTASGHSVASTSPMSSGYRSDSSATSYDRSASSDNWGMTSASPSTVASISPFSNSRPTSTGVSMPSNPYASNRSVGGHSVSRPMSTNPLESSYRQHQEVPTQFTSQPTLPQYVSQQSSPQVFPQPSYARQPDHGSVAESSVAQSVWNGEQLRGTGAVESSIPMAPGAGLKQVQYLPPVNEGGHPQMSHPGPMPNSAWQGAPAMQQPSWNVNSWHSAPEGEFDSTMISGIEATIDGPHVIKIPVRLGEGETLDLTEADITLHDGDIVFIESRGSEVFYTGGLLGGGQYTLPRDYDLRVLDALSIAQARGSVGSSRSLGGVSALNQDVTVSASKVIVLRTLADGSRLPIEVDLRRIKRNMTSRENILMQPGDHLILQYSKVEAIGALLERHLLEGALFGLAASQLTSN